MYTKVFLTQIKVQVSIGSSIDADVLFYVKPNNPFKATAIAIEHYGESIIDRTEITDQMSFIESTCIKHVNTALMLVPQTKQP